ncbi:MAG: pitrilysin family protein [Thermodesulforhabdaceae bacterium]
MAKKCVFLCILFLSIFLWQHLSFGELSPLVDQLLPSKSSDDKFVRLKNGLTVLIRSDDSTPVVSTYILVKAGSIYEPTLSGLSHYLEHVVSGGSTKFLKESDIRRKIEQMGGAANAFTSHNRTVYYINTTREHYREAIELLLSFVHDCAFDPTEVEREKGVIMEEARMQENDPGKQLWNLFFETAYQKHPVRYPVIGRMDVFARQTREDLIRYYENRYIPANIVVCVVGPVRPEDVISLIAEKTSDWDYTPPEETVLPEEPLPVAKKQAEKELPFVDQERIMVGFPSVNLSHPDVYALDVLATIAGEGNSSLLVKELKEEKRLVSSISAFNWTPSYVRGQWIVSLTPVPGKRAEAMEALEQALHAIADQGVSTEDLEMAKRKTISQHIFERTTSSGQALSLLSGFNETGDPYFDEAYVEKIKAVTVEEVQQVAKRYLRWDLATIAAVKPPSGSTSNNNIRKSTGASPQNSNEPLIKTLSNGLRVILKPDHKLPIVAIELHGLGGQLLDPSDKSGLSHITASLLTAGTENYSRSDIFRIIESNGGKVSAGAGRNSYSVSMKVLADNLPQAIDILSEMVSKATFPESELEKKRQETLLAIDRAKENWQQELSIIFHEHFFKEHPYRFYHLGSRESVSKLTKADVVECYHRMVVPARSVLAIFGDFDKEEVLKLLEEKVGSWKRKAPPFPYPPKTEFSPQTKDSSIVVKTSKTALGIMVGTSGIEMNDPRRAILDVIDANISGIGYPSGRLQEALRGGNQDLVYVVHAIPFYGIKGGYFTVIAQTALEHRERVKAIIFQELQKTATNLMTPQDIATAKNIILTMEALSLEDISDQARDAALNEALGLGWNFRKKLHEKLEQVTPEDVMKLAKDLFEKTLTVETIPQGKAEAKE